MLGFNVFAADTDEEAQVRATSMQQAFVNLRSGRPAKLPPPRPGYREQAGPAERALLDSVLSCATIGSPETVRRGLQGLHRAHRRRRTDDRLADVRPRRAPALLRDRGAGARQPRAGGLNPASCTATQTPPPRNVPCARHGSCCSRWPPRSLLSQAYRTVAAMMATQLQRDFGLSAQQLGLFAGIFHFSFGALQLLMGIGIDFHGVRRTVLAAFPLTIAGALLSALAPSYRPGGARAGADRHRLRAGLPGVHGVHRAPVSGGAVCIGFRAGAGDRRPGHAAHRHAAGLGGGSEFLAHGISGAGGGLGAGLARHFRPGARAGLHPPGTMDPASQRPLRQSAALFAHAAHARASWRSAP